MSSQDFLTGNTKKYWDLIFTDLKPLLLRLSKDATSKKMLTESIFDSLVGVEVEREPSPDKRTKNELFLANILFRPWIEINSSYDSLCNIVIYIRRFPYSKEGITPTTYMRYNLENYLNELYLLKERLIGYINRAIKSYANSKDFKKKKDAASVLKKTVENAFRNYANARGSHIHQHRYDDFDLNRLNLFERLMKGPATDDLTVLIKKLHKKTVSEVKKKWIAKITEDISAIKNLLDVFFSVMYSIISSNDSIDYP